MTGTYPDLLRFRSLRSRLLDLDRLLCSRERERLLRSFSLSLSRSVVQKCHKQSVIFHFNNYMCLGL